jgi:probable F420-dependent oxidoreductase
MMIGVSATSLYTGGADPSSYAAAASAADDLGFESLWVGHHVALPFRPSASYPYTADGTFPYDAGMQRLDPLVLIGHMAAATSRLRFGCGVYLLPLIHPLITARAAMTADVLSGGRLILGVGVGWSHEEFEMLGADFRTRGRRTDEIIELLHAVWSEGPVAFEGQFYSFGRIEFEPKPAQRPSVPIVVGGESPQALRRAATADGAYFLSSSPEKVASMVAAVNSHRRDLGRDAEPFQFTMGMPADAGPRLLEELAGLGVDRVVLDPGSQFRAASDREDEPAGPAYLRALERAAKHLLQV